MTLQKQEIHVFPDDLMTEFTGVDTEAPVISNCPADIVVGPDPGQTYATVTWQEPTAVDNSGAEPSSTQTQAPGQRFDVGQSYVVTYLFYDANFNSAVCQFTITVSGENQLCILYEEGDKNIDLWLKSHAVVSLCSYLLTCLHF